jgi:molybdenum-dependent DNA-binding transcriptional regulator ModE
MAIYLLNSSKKGMSALQMHRMMGGSYKTAWFMMRRIREAMREGKLPGGLGGQNKVVEADRSLAARRVIADIFLCAVVHVTPRRERRCRLDAQPDLQQR